MGNLQSDAAKRSTSVKRSPNEPPSYLINLSKKLVSKTLVEEDLNGISETVFLKYVCNANRLLGEQLFRYFLSHEENKSETQENKSETQQLLSPKIFIAQSMHLLALITDGEQLQYFIQVYTNGSDTITYNIVYELVHAAYQIAQSAHPICCLPDDILSAVVKAAMHGKSSLSCKYLHNWMCEHCPRIVSWMHRYFSHTLTVAHHTIETLEEENEKVTPVLECGSNTSCVNLHPALVWLLSCTLPQLYTKNQAVTESPSLTQLRNPHYIMQKLISSQSPTHWTQLYHSNEHGLSVNRFQHHVFGYNGPTLLILTAEDDNMFCVACDTEWKDSKHFWGGPYCLCLQLLPQYKVVETGAKMIYFNTTSRGFPTGFQIGIDFTNRSLSLDTDLSKVHYKRIPYKLKAMEVWGCGSLQIMETQQEIKKLQKTDVEKARKVNLNSVDWVDNPDRYLLQMANGAEPKYAAYDRNTQDHTK